MNNINFLKHYQYNPEIMGLLYLPDIGHKLINNLFNKACTEGLSNEQIKLFYKIIRLHNNYVYDNMRSIRYQINNSKSTEYAYFDESELGDYAGEYIVDYEASISEKEKENLLNRLDKLKSLLISFKGKRIKRDYTKRIPLLKTLHKWYEFEKFLNDDSKDIRSSISEFYDFIKWKSDPVDNLDAPGIEPEYTLNININNLHLYPESSYAHYCTMHPLDMTIDESIDILRVSDIDDLQRIDPWYKDILDFNMDIYNDESDEYDLPPF